MYIKLPNISISLGTIEISLLDCERLLNQNAPGIPIVTTNCRSYEHIYLYANGTQKSYFFSMNSCTQCRNLLMS